MSMKNIFAWLICRTTHFCKNRFGDGTAAEDPLFAYVEDSGGVYKCKVCGKKMYWAGA